MTGKIKGYLRSNREVLLGVFGTLLFMAGFASGFFFRSHLSPVETALSRGMEYRLTGYALINPLLECETADDTEGDSELAPFKKEIAGFIDKKLEGEKSLAKIAVYFRQLNNGPWFGIDESETFAPASMLKVPVMMAVLREAETNPAFLKKRITYRSRNDVSFPQNIVPQKRVEDGHSYTIDDLLYRTIAYSDNAASDLILSDIGMGRFNTVLMDLTGKTLTDDTPENFMTVHEYASFFRTLFNASYLNKEMSQKALLYLTGTTFRDGIVAGVPQGVVVAHKFGERAMGVTEGIKELHDCGIVYYPNDPYLICIMTKGSDFSLLDDEIREVSALVYQKYDEGHKSNPARVPQ